MYAEINQLVYCSNVLKLPTKIFVSYVMKTATFNILRQCVKELPESLLGETNRSSANW